jgi:threonine dehydrogenase-like Zn-dependent dehydrogenase
MRAIVAETTVPRYLWTTAAQRLRHDAGWQRGGLLRLVDDAQEPALPGPDWVRLGTELAGICGSDVGLAHAKLSLVLSAYYTASRTIPGHEVVAVVDEVGSAVTTLEPGDRVVLDPVLSCVHRGFDPVCGSCARGRPHTCDRFDLPGTSGCVAPTQGFDATVGGGFGTRLVAHVDQCLKVGEIPSRRAVLAEPTAVALHAALRWRRGGDRAVVIGPGTIGLLVTAALRRFHPDLDVTVVSPDEFGTERAQQVGASRVVPTGAAAIHALADQDGGRVLTAKRTPLPLLEHGVDAVFDCVGLPATVDLGLHLLRAGGTFVLVGAAGQQPVDWSLVWNRELTVVGTVNGGPEPTLDGRRSIEHAVAWLADDAFPVDRIVTHLAPLERWQDAFATASAGPRVRAGKVVLQPDPELPLVGEVHARRPAGG